MKLFTQGALVCAVVLCGVAQVQGQSAAPLFPVQDFTLQTPQGDSLKLSSLRGRVVVLNIWSTTCQPCLEEIPDLNSLHGFLSPDGLTVVGLATDGDEDKAAVNRLVEQLDIIYPVVYGSTEVAQSILAVSGDSIPPSRFYDNIFNGTRLIVELDRMVPLPTTLVIDQDGHITERIVGIMPKDEMSRMLQAMLIPKGPVNLP